MRSNVSGDQKTRLRRWPTKLTSLLRRSVQTAAGNQNFYVEARQSCSWRAGLHKHCALNSLSRWRERVGVRGIELLPPLGEGGDGGLCCCLLGQCACGEEGSRVSARQPPYFLLLRQKKVSQEKATLLPASLRFRSGQPAVLACGVRRRTRYALGKRFAQTAAASQMDEACAAWAAHTTPQAARLGAGRRELGGISRRISEWNMPPAPMQQAQEAMNLLLTPSPACGRGQG